MSYLMAAVLGIIQGVAEFLPISSSGHLTLFQHFFGMPETDNLFNVLLHFATLIAVFVYYWSDIWEMITEFFLGIRALFVPQYRSQGEPPAARRLILLIIVATLPCSWCCPSRTMWSRSATILRRSAASFCSPVRSSSCLTGWPTDTRPPGAPP